MPWYYVREGQQAGPVSEAEFEAMVSSGSVSPETLVWKEGMENWQPYTEVRPHAVAMEGTQSLSGADLPSAYGNPASASGAASSAGSIGGMVQCSQCGRYFADNEVIRYGTVSVCPGCSPQFVQSLRAGGRAAAESLDYAGFWIRLVARIVDGLITGAVIWAILLASGVSLDPQTWVNGFPRIPGMARAAALFIPFVYEVIMLSLFGATLGKLAVQIRVVNETGTKMSGGQVIGRSIWTHWNSIIPVLGPLVYVIGCIMAAFDDEKRALHDRVLKTRVVRV